MVHGLKRVAVRVPADEVCAHCGTATKGVEGRRFGFLLFSDDNGGESVKVRFLGPRGYSDEDVPNEQVLGFVGENFFVPSSAYKAKDIVGSSRSPIGEHAVFFDSDWQRIVGVWEVDQLGKATLFINNGRFAECWAEELVLFPLGKGAYRLSEEEIEKLDAHCRSNGDCVSEEPKGGKSELLMRAERGAEEIRALLAET
ncbi:MAG: hypothetical protein HYW90_01290 [Candidatus Sungbacteria bacterium]|nr:hypothetical protein [Candidatus Sungbacteria bacterium]